MDNILISLKNINKSYQTGETKSVALNNINLEIKKGEMLAIVGASGSGKSTLMNILGLLDNPDAGTYILNNCDVSSLSYDELADIRNLQVGFVFQQFHLLPRLTSNKNIMLPLLYRNISKTEMAQKITNVLARVKMAGFGDRLPSELSGGQQQRIAIARALVGEPEVILADEPTGALDSNTSKEIMELFKELNTEGSTIIIVTHDEAVAAKCSRRITLKDGEIVKAKISCT